MASLESVLPREALATNGEEVAPEGRLGARPESVVRPGSTAEVVAIVEWANREGVGVLPMASGLRLDSIPRPGRFVALSTERLAGVEIYEPADLTLTAGAGTPVREITANLAENAQWLPFDPPHVADRSIGGLVATGDSGPLRTGYGELRNHVLGMTVVTGDARVVRLGGRVVKNVAGYDLLKPMVGSRGTLGVITSICVRTFPLAAVDRVLMLEADSPSALAVATHLVATAPVMPVSSVLVDGSWSLGPSAALLVRLHGSAATVDADQEMLERHLGHPLGVLAPERARRVLEVARDHAAEAELVLRVSVLPERLGALLPLVEELATDGLVVDGYGGRARIGLHSAEPEPIETLREAVEKMGGALGVLRGERSGLAGRGSRPSGGAVELAEAVRSTFDPEGTLWPSRA